MSNVIDISAHLPMETATVQIKAPDGSDMGWSVTLAGPTHPKTVALNDLIADRNLKKSRDIEASQINRKPYEPPVISPGQMRREAASDMAARIIDWTPIQVNGEVYDVSRAAELLVLPGMEFAVAQILEAITVEKLFTRRSASA
ncbi:hypothetical protein [Rhizobium sp. CSW-27]|uniref:hypothetical protein n=1 Tax=Rhizobium sp. CSW-27 TaxID=2839985 RepID=UPI001C032641|nr:hypothetical protein [Rhizobium sp. CSW-27]MBT9370273.1 hypothetical protein [Rhizobium sp. CSW-27]